MVIETESSTEAASPITGPLSSAKKSRRYRKRTLIKQVPKMPWPVNALWEAASEEERLHAHKLSITMLEMWLGKISKQEASERLGLPPLRLWQMSQQALAGMTAGLLKQPKRRPRGRPSLENPQESSVELRRQLAKMEKDLQMHVGLVALLRELPMNRSRAKPELKKEINRREESTVKAATVKPEPVKQKKNGGTEAVKLPPESFPDNLRTANNKSPRGAQSRRSHDRRKSNPKESAQRICETAGDKPANPAIVEK